MQNKQGKLEMSCSIVLYRLKSDLHAAWEPSAQFFFFYLM